MSLAEELLADLEDFEEDDTLQDNSVSHPDVEKEELKNDVKSANIHELAKLCKSERLLSVMRHIEELQNGHKPTANKTNVNGPVEVDPEYMLIVNANNLAVEIDNEISIIHKFVRDKYSKRFPELESLVVSPLEYVNTVKELGNDLDQAKNNEKLQQFLTQATIMVVSVTASTTQGQLLTDEELAEIKEACDMAIDLNACKLKIYEFVESRMTFIAPNLSFIIGASTAAKLMGIAGGLSNLSKFAACNVLLLGAQKKALAGLSKVSALPHTGYIYHSDIVQVMPPDLRRKAARLIAAKCTLAARVDAAHENPDGSFGRQLKEEIEKKFDKLTEPPPVKFVKPLPKPVDPSRKRRGGKKVRKMKERYAVTEFRKQQNRLNFADIDDEAYQEDFGYSRGTIGKAGTGRIRTAQVDEKTKVRISKTLQKNLQKQQVWGGSTSVRKQVSGTASSVAFTPSQGLEIVNPQAAERNSGDLAAKYFSNTAGFLRVNRQ
ncbi:hypothetical protein V9T40_012782 [Parthenolecanium corni]|uniref:U4/U6 small nuclear ribonucleoprotein Prp31 n=1 Tax=Parthenolecanium corni TaxID=536013 RepID=A0AAN9XZF8_9HEMI